MSDLVLALDTSTPQLSAALLLRQGKSLKLLALRDVPPPVIGSTLVPSVFDELLEEAAVSKERLGLLVTGVGPGLFTGVRVAVATMKALAYAMKLPLLGAQSLKAMSLAAARGAPVEAGQLISARDFSDSELLCPVLDARKGEVYFALYRAEKGQLSCLHSPQAGSPQELAEILRKRAQAVRVFGSGLEPMKPWLGEESMGERSVLVTLAVGPRFPGAAELAALAVDEAVSPTFSLEEVLALEPLYLRPPEAQVVRERKLAAMKNGV